MISVTKNSNQKSAAASWNATSSCLLSSRLQHHVVNCACELYHFMNFGSHIARSYVKTLAYTTGTTSKHQRAMWPELYPKSIVFLCIVAWHMRVFSHLPNVWSYGEGMLRCFQKRWKKRISTPNYETSSCRYMTAKKPIGNMYFMYVDMAWF